MPFNDYLNQLRQKPEGERRRITAALAGLATVLVAGLWLINLRLSLSREPSLVVPPSPFAAVAGVLGANSRQIGKGLEVVKEEAAALFNQEKTINYGQ